MVELTGSLAWKIFTASVPILVSRFYFQDKATDQFAADRELQENYTLPLNETFDFIIVGGGTAGCILARRLSEEYSVLLLEAGGEPPPVTRISNLKSHTTGLANVNWYPKYTKQDDASLENGGLLPALYAAKMLGGSFSHNNAHYERGSPYDYDNWANWTGDASWNYTSILKYFLKLENYKGHFTSNNGQHGYNGLIDLVASKMPFREDLFFSAGRELGYDVSIDPNGPQRVGFSPAEYNTHKGLRVSTYTAYLKPIMGKRDNLVVRKYSVVSKVLFKNNNRVEGVHYYRHGVPRVAFASKEVILSAGTFNSPMILIQSGIGPKDQLEPFKIQQLADLPVGLNYQTHSELQLSISVKDKSVFRLTSDKVTFEDLQEFKINGTGFLGCREALQEAFIVSTRAIIDGQSNWPDIQLFFRQSNRHGQDVLTCSVHQTRPRSIGRLLVNTSADTLEDVLTPILDFKFFSDETDFDVLIDGIRVCQKIVKTSTFQQIGAELLDTNLPACSHLAPDSRAYWKCVIRQKSTGLFHATGTVRMGASADKSSVLDSSLRVRDVEGLRVVDQSVFPFITNANTNAAVMLVAEKASEEILLAWKLLRKVIH